MPGLPKRTKNGDKILCYEDGKPVYARNSEGKPVCNSPLRAKPGKRCRQWRDLGPAGRCRLHNGWPMVLSDNHNFKDGTYSKYLAFMPEQVRESYEKFALDADYLSLREDIALVRNSIAAQIKALGGMDGDVLQEIFFSADQAQELLDGEYEEGEVEQVLRNLLEAVGTAQELLGASERVAKTQEHLRKLTETESRRLQSEQEMMPAIRVLALMKALSEIVNTQVYAFLMWLAKEYPEVLTDPRYWNPLETISTQSMALTGGLALTVPPKLKSGEEGEDDA